MKNIILILLASTSLICAQIPTNGLVAYYPFNGNANDESGNANNGTVNGATLTTDRFGNVNSAYSFDGVDDYIEVSHHNSLNLDQDYSISVFIKISENLPVIANRIFTKDDASDYKFGWSMFLNGHDIRWNHYPSNGSSIHHWVTNTTVVLNTWTNIAVTYSSLNGKTFLYVNGSIRDSITYLDKIASNTLPLLIGKYSGGQNFKGIIDDITIYNQTLSKDEILKIYQHGMCSDTVINDTIVYQVSSSNFSMVNDKTNLLTTDSLKTNKGNCDSIINHYERYVYNPTYCTVEDTLNFVIDIPTGVNTSISNEILIFPNPAKSHVNINYGKFNSMTGYSIKILNSLSQQVYTENITKKETSISASSIGGTGMYFIQFIDNSSNIVETKKLMLE